jgi:hypothetical protein
MNAIIVETFIFMVFFANFTKTHTHTHKKKKKKIVVVIICLY